MSTITIHLQLPKVQDQTVTKESCIVHKTRISVIQFRLKEEVFQKEDAFLLNIH